KDWSLYFMTVVVGFYVHEIGHCIPAWFYGYTAVPTPAKEYLLEAVPPNLINTISLGGIIGSVLFSLSILLFYTNKKFGIGSSMLAGAMVPPGIYTMRFILQGRGHDATEFQEAQSSMGFSYSGHAVDWIFLVIFASGVVIWILKSKPDFAIVRRWAIGFIVTICFVIFFQKFNNLIFDPIFQSGM
ncbi:MAG: hypothetical protein Q8908_11365, partial [Bacteroidota bacterium]|nr:hypothetical protein [Bacteroidota bacterium]